MGMMWQESLAVGVPEIDNQHKELLSRFNKLLNACRQGKEKRELVRLLAFLDEYAVRHFQAEEIILMRCNYPEYAEHKKEHDRFADKLKALKVEITLDGVATRHVIETNKLVFAWWKDHVAKVDQKMGKYLKSHAVVPSHVDLFSRELREPGEREHGLAEGQPGRATV
ncbi:bacteriohemerythrin [Geobacter sp. FeAm09]|uniref:bacteriohemerythrin n=1 Tax=Geobacter sp. FeAm09 TaxID=2597769 RepID=UPI0011F01B51|nr:hemerythrin family protein [Geobacter sp. FeAm09]QEM67823.1 bacteriohemerythrin [Geobacter sp. FeAm09]